MTFRLCDLLVGVGGDLFYFGSQRIPLLLQLGEFLFTRCLLACASTSTCLHQALSGAVRRIRFQEAYRGTSTRSSGFFPAIPRHRTSTRDQGQDAAEAQEFDRRRCSAIGCAPCGRFRAATGRKRGRRDPGRDRRGVEETHANAQVSRSVTASWPTGRASIRESRRPQRRGGRRGVPIQYYGTSLSIPPEIVGPGVAVALPTHCAGCCGSAARHRSSCGMPSAATSGACTSWRSATHAWHWSRRSSYHAGEGASGTRREGWGHGGSQAHREDGRLRHGAVREQRLVRRHRVRGTA